MATKQPNEHAIPDTAGMAGRVAAVLLILAGVVTMATVGLPEPEAFNRTSVLAVGAAGAVLGLVLAPLPWHRWSPRTSLVLVVPALTLIALHNWFGGQDPYRYSIFFVVVFVWVGTFYPRGTSAVLAIPTAVAYLVPLVASGASAFALWSAAYAIPMFVTVGEILAWRGARVNQLEAELRSAALHDPLTGLGNRRLAMDRLTEALARTTRSGGYVHVLYLDVDEFKAINDQFGHDAGDSMLITVGEVLSSVVRPFDTVARFAGDEFVVLMESSEPETGRLTAERILEALHDRDRSTPPVLVPTVSIGVASASGGLVLPDVLLRAADTALYSAKQTGRDRVFEHASLGA